MNKDNFFQLGKITQLHGYKGACKLFLDVDDPSAYRGLDGIFLDMNGQLVPFFTHRFELKGNSAVVHFEGVDSEEAAQALVNKQAWLPLDLLPKLEGKQFYFHEVIGFTIVDQNFGEVGKIDAITDHSTNPLFIVIRDGKEILLPMTDQFLVEVNREKEEIVLNTPEGLIDIYL
ncbi:ribosome maturation factor RimM [Sanyastnella coralliicola]|uniref:ribosome maturation factor RimM n=1 Tax=Sanyastnella coralliicola TaxID=3069118 RepID=UPI0027B9DCE1|nr:ribosome maturation factor RimM [Longitalea sp. SCSIO 12813]